MHIVEIIYPGTNLDYPDRDLAIELEWMLRFLVDRVGEAAVALTMFEISNHSRTDSRAELDADDQIRKEIYDQLRVESGDLYVHHYKYDQLEIERRVLKRKAELGIVPRSYAHKIPFIYAHAFVYAVDSFERFLEELCTYDTIPPAVLQVTDEFNNRLPMVRKIRNSAVHLEDRSRRYASDSDKRKGKRMEVEGFLGLSNLEGNQLCYTIDDGTYQKLAVSPESLGVLVETINKVLRAFSWNGPPHVEPS